MNPQHTKQVASNPTPRPYLRVLYKNNKSKGAKKFTRGDSLLEKKTTIPLTIGNSYSNFEKLDNPSIIDKIDTFDMETLIKVANGASRLDIKQIDRSAVRIEVNSVRLL